MKKKEIELMAKLKKIYRGGKMKTLNYIAILEKPTTKSAGKGGRLICGDCVVEVPFEAELYFNRGSYELRLKDSPYFKFEFTDKGIKDFVGYLGKCKVKYREKKK